MLEKNPALFLEISQKYYKLDILGSLGMPDNVHQKQQHQLKGNFDVYLQIKDQLDLSIYLEILHFKESCNLIG